MDAAVNLEVLRLKGLANESELNLLGNIYMEQGEAQLALFAYLEAIEKAPKLDVARALKSARILNDYGYPEKAAAFVDKVAKTGGLSSKEQMDLDLVRVKIAKTAGDSDQVGTLLRDLFARDSANPEIRLELAKHYDNLAKNETDEGKRAANFGEAKNYYKFALESPTVAYDANLGLGQLFVREKQYTDSIPYIERALSLKNGDKSTLEQYLSRVRRAADRETQRKEREAAERAAAEEADAKSKAK
jgi:tetratricopeptide (TPR) repeat protein